MPVIDPTKINMAVPAYGLDQIIGIIDETESIGIPTSGAPDFGQKVLTFSFPHEFGDSCYFEGRFTTDGGVTWNDFGAQQPDLSTPGFPVFQTLDCEAMIDSTNVNVTLTNTLNFVTNVGVAYTVHFQIYLIAKNTMANPITPIATTDILAFSSEFNYQKIFLKDTVALNVIAGAVGFSTTTPHTLGYVPKIRAFCVNGSNQVTKLNQNEVEAHLTASGLVFYSDQSGFSQSGISINIEFRIYLDS